MGRQAAAKSEVNAPGPGHLAVCSQLGSVVFCAPPFPSRPARMCKLPRVQVLAPGHVLAPQSHRPALPVKGQDGLPRPSLSWIRANSSAVSSCPSSSRLSAPLLLLQSVPRFPQSLLSYQAPSPAPGMLWMVSPRLTSPHGPFLCNAGPSASNMFSHPSVHPLIQ